MRVIVLGVVVLVIWADCAQGQLSYRGNGPRGSCLRGSCPVTRVFPLVWEYEKNLPCESLELDLPSDCWGLIVCGARI